MPSSSSNFTPLLSSGDPSPDMYIAPPLSSEFKAVLQAKTQLVIEICIAYHSIRVPSGTRPCSWSRSGKGFKEVTSWMHGLLFTMSKDSLEYLVENPDAAEELCDNAQKFLFFCSGNEHFSNWYHFHDSSWKERQVLNDLRINFEDTTCIVSKKKGVLRDTFIMPARTHSNACAKQLLKSLASFPATLFDSRIAARILSLLASETSHPFTHHNTITLNPYLSHLFDAGFLALRPLALSKRTNPGGLDKHLVHFSVHWMPQTSCNPNDYVGIPYHPNILRILEASREYDKNKNGLCEFNAETKQPIADGDECFAEHSGYPEAENMFIMLAFRWSVTLAFCLAGGIGLSEEEVFTDYEDDVDMS